MFGFSVLILLGCRQSPIDTGSEIQTRPDNEPAVTDPVDELRDVDSDGFWDDVDCDDWNPNIYPGAEEILNNEDDDCDGYIDSDGVYEGTLALHAVAVYQGQPFTFTQTCEGVVERIVGQVEMNVFCDIDQSQDRANQLLGGSITMVASENFVFERIGSSRVTIESTGGETEWDAFGEVNWSWSSWEDDKSAQLDTQIVLDALHLDIEVSGDLNRQ